MKLQLTQHNEKYTIESSDDDIGARDMVEYMYQLLLAAGYHSSPVNTSIFDKADELGAEEGWCMQPNPSDAPEEIRSSFEDVTFLEANCTTVKSRYGDARYFYDLGDGTLVYKFFDDPANVGMSFTPNKEIHSLDPSGGPFISIGTNLRQYISEQLPDKTVKCISHDNNKGAYLIKLDK